MLFGRLAHVESAQTTRGSCSRTGKLGRSLRVARDTRGELGADTRCELLHFVGARGDLVWDLDDPPSGRGAPLAHERAVGRDVVVGKPGEVRAEDLCPRNGLIVAGEAGRELDERCGESARDCRRRTARRHRRALAECSEQVADAQVAERPDLSGADTQLVQRSGIFNSRPV